MTGNIILDALEEEASKAQEWSQSEITRMENLRRQLEESIRSHYENLAKAANQLSVVQRIREHESAPAVASTLESPAEAPAEVPAEAPAEVPAPEAPVEEQPAS